MAYPGNSELSPRAQERVMSAFRLVITNLQDGRKDDALVGLDFVLRLDPSFSPALALQKQLSSGEGVVSLEGVLAQIDAPATEEINLLLVEAIEDFQQHHLVEAREKVGRVLLDLPGHEDARNLARQIDEALEKEAQVGHFLTQAREALNAGDPQEASNFVMMAQALDPHHPGIHPTLEEIQQRGRALMEEAGAVHHAAPPVTEAAMPEAFELESPEAGGFGEPAVAAMPGAEAISTAASGSVPEVPVPDFGEEPPAFEASGVGDLFEDVGAPVDAGGSGQQGRSDGLDPGVAAAYADAADNWRIESPEEEHPDSAPAFAAPAAEIAAKEEPEEESWGPDFENFGDDVSDLFSADSVEEVVEPSTDPIGSLPSLEEPAPEEGAGDFGMAPDAVAEAAEESLPGMETAPAAVAEAFPEAEMPPASDGFSDAGEPGGDEEDLFSDDFSVSDEIDEMERRSREAEAAHVPASRGLPLKMIVLGVLAFAVLLGGMWLGMRMMGSGNSDEDRARVIQQLLHDADGLLKQGKPEEALHLLQNFQADDMERDRIQKHILRIKEAMAPPTPTPAPEESVKARELLEAGDWFGAFEEVQKGLSVHPQDPGLQDLKTEIVHSEEQAMPLFRAMEKQDDRSVASIAMELEQKYPDEKRISELADRSLFNGALKELRSYNLAGARRMLVQLHDRRPDDAEVARILEFTSKYIKKPADMQLEIFVGSIKKR